MIKNDDGKKLTAKQWAADMLSLDIPCLFDYYYERHNSYGEMTESEQLQVAKQVAKFQERFEKLLNKSLKQMGIE